MLAYWNEQSKHLKNQLKGWGRHNRLQVSGFVEPSTAMYAPLLLGRPFSAALTSKEDSDRVAIDPQFTFTYTTCCFLESGKTPTSSINLDSLQDGRSFKKAHPEVGCLIWKTHKKRAQLRGLFSIFVDKHPKVDVFPSRTRGEWPSHVRLLEGSSWVELSATLTWLGEVWWKRTRQRGTKELMLHETQHFPNSHV